MSGFQSHRTLDPPRWLGLPMLACVVGTIVLAIPLRLFGHGLPEPVFAFIPAFAWAVIRPAILGPVMLLVLGLFLDLFWGGLLGLWPLALILAYGFVLLTRPVMSGQGRIGMWAWYAATCAVGFLGAYLAIMVRGLTTPNLLATVYQFAFTVALYPVTHLMIQQFEDADVRFR